MELLPAFPDAEAVVMDLLAAHGTTVTSTPAEITGPLIRVQRVGGADDGITDRPRIEVLCYHTTRPLAVALAAECRRTIAAAGCTQVGSVLIDRAFPEMAPSNEGYRNPDIRAVPAVYRFAWRRSRTA